MPLQADPADQALLLELQALDSTATRIAARRARLPEQAVLDELTADRDQRRRLVVDESGSLEDARAELRRTEADVAVVDARIARDEERLRTSSSPKDVQALEQELAALAKRKTDLEDIELVVMETVEERESALATTRTALEELTGRLAEAHGARDTAVAELDREASDAVAARAELAARIPDELLALYEKQRARYGVGASLLRGGVSTAVGVALTGSDLGAVRAAAPTDVLLDPESNAILVRTPESGL